MEKTLIMNIIVQTEVEIDEVLSSECCDRVEDGFYAVIKKLSDDLPDDFEETSELEEYRNSLLKLIEYSVNKGVRAAAKSLAVTSYTNPSLTCPSS